MSQQEQAIIQQNQIEREQAENSRFQTLSLPHLEVQIGLITKRVESLTGTLIPQLRNGDLDEFIEEAPTESGKTARRNLATPHTLPGRIDLTESIKTVERIGHVIGHLEEASVPTLQTRLQELVAEWRRRKIERDDVGKEVDRIEKEYVEKGRLSQTYVDRLRLEIAQMSGTYYPTREITDVIAVTTKPQQEKPTRDDATKQETETAGTIIPVPQTTLAALELFALRSRFSSEGNLAMSDEEVIALTGATAKKGNTEKRAIGSLSTALPKVRGGRGVKEPIYLGKHQTYLSLRAALAKLATRADTPEGIFPEELHTIQQLETFTGQKDFQTALAEANRRLDVLFGKVQTPKPIQAPKAPSIPPAQLNTFFDWDPVRNFLTTRPDSTTDDVLQAFPEIATLDRARQRIRSILFQQRRRMSSSSAASATDQDRTTPKDAKSNNWTDAIATIKTGGQIRIPGANAQNASTLEAELQAAAQEVGIVLEFKNGFSKTGEYIFLARQMSNSNSS